MDKINQPNENKKCKIMSERLPKIGDMYCLLYGQMGTIGILLDDIDMPFDKYGLKKSDIIVNSDPTSSRMTIGQLAEYINDKNAKLKSDFSLIDNHDIVIL